MNKKLVTALVVMGALAGCTDPGEKTAISAATGGVLGAGLGAIVGNQTGDPGTGFVVGALAGGAAGAAVGNALEAQEVSMRTQDEAIERQQKVIQAQSAEISELRRANGDAPLAARRPTATQLHGSSARGSSASVNRAVSASNGRDADRYARTSTDSSAQTIGAAPRYGKINSDTAASVASERIASRDITPSNTNDSAERARLGWADTLEDPAVNSRLERAEQEVAREPAESAQKIAEHSPEGSECVQARAEHDKALGAEDPSEQLFHLRRALRLCPDQASAHASLGEAYLRLNRKEDALFEFKEALRLDPTLESAQAHVRSIENVPGGRY